jgi:hypothetical protein
LKDDNGDQQQPSRRARQQRVPDSRQQPLFGVRQFRSQPYEPTSIFGMLEQFGELIISREDYPEPAHTGPPSWCRVLLSKLVILQRHHGWSDRETVDRATNDLRVKACLGLGIEQEGPSQPKLSTHRSLMQQLGLTDVYEQRFVELVKLLELLDPHEPVLVDSVPVTGAGQVLDAYNLIAAAIRSGLKRLAKVTGESEQDVASRLELAPFLARSVKGRFDVDWEDKGSRRQFLVQLEATAQRLLRAIDAALENGDSDDDGGDDDDDGGLAALEDSAEVLNGILTREVERDEHGEVKGIVQREADDRIISATDPDMRHGRKSSSVLICGYKAQIIASLVYGWILLARVFRANVHDGQDLPAQLEELDAMHGLTPAWLGGDHAYGTLANHIALSPSDQPELIARMPRPANGGRFTKDEFDIDFDSVTLTCPAGHQLPRSRFATRQGKRGWLFEFPYELCRACPAMADCVNPKAQQKGRSVFVVEAEERLIRQHLERRREADFRDKLAQRVKVEHTIGGFAQCAGKRVRRFRQAHADFDVRLSALGCNLRRLGSVLRQRPELVEQLRRQLAATNGSEDSDEHASGRSPLFLAPAAAARTTQLAAAVVLLAVLMCATACGMRGAARLKSCTRRVRDDATRRRGFAGLRRAAAAVPRCKSCP